MGWRKALMPFRDQRKPICEVAVAAFHEPPPHPFPLPIRWGEGGRRPGEGRFMVPMHAEKRKGALHEPYPRSRWLLFPRIAALCRDAATAGFMAPMRAQKRKEAFQEPRRVGQASCLFAAASRNVIVLCLVSLIGICRTLALDLSKAVVCSPQTLSGPEKKAVTMLIEEVEK